MPNPLIAALPLLPVTLAPAALVLVSPWLGRTGRTVIGALLAVAGAAFVGDVLIIDHSERLESTVVNVFPRGDKAEAFVWEVATAIAPAWHWHLWAAALLGVPGLWLLATRRRQPGSPAPVPFGVVLFLWYFVARLGLEHAALDREIVWAVGGTPLLVLLLPFFGAACGARGQTFGRYCRALLAMALLQRVAVVAWGYLATTRGLGTHLDTHRVTDVHILGEHRLDDPLQAWLWPTLIPHLTLWIASTLAGGLVLGALPFLVARRRANARARTGDLAAR